MSVISGFRWLFNRNLIVVNLNSKCLIGNQFYLYRIGALVTCADFIFQFSYGILANPEVLYKNLTVGIGLEYLIVIFTGYAE